MYVPHLAKHDLRCHGHETTGGGTHTLSLTRATVGFGVVHQRLSSLLDFAQLRSRCSCWLDRRRGPGADGGPSHMVGISCVWMRGAPMDTHGRRRGSLCVIDTGRASWRAATSVGVHGSK